MLTLENAPIGTKAPAIGGGHWVRTERGWKWCTGATFPRPGGDWTGELMKPVNFQPKGSQCTACKHRNGPCSHLPFHEMPVCNTLPDGTKVVICREFERRNVK